MIKRIRTNEKGFTLIELMIVVAIIGILAAIAIPNFLQYQLKSKTAEAKTNIGSIRTSQESFKAEYDFYMVCIAAPAANPIGAKQAWPVHVAGNGWPEIGYQPAGDVYYQYEIAIGGNNPAANILGVALANFGDDMTISARSDLDADAAFGEWGFSTDFTVVATTGTVAGANTASNALEDLNPGVF